MIFRRWKEWSLLPALLLAVGCNGGPKLVTATGTVLKDGKPLELSPTGVVQVILVPDVGPESNFTTLPGRADKATGKFVIEEVPAGKYRIAIEQMDPTPANDALGGAYSVKNSKISREIDGKTAIEIDLAKEK